MAKKAKASKEIIRRTIRLKFLTDAGKTHTISLNYASARLAGTEGPALVKRVMEKVLEYDIFTVKLVKAICAELVERRVLLTADGRRIDIDIERAKKEAAPGVYEEEKADEITYFRTAAISGQRQAAIKNGRNQKESPGQRQETAAKDRLFQRFT